MNIDMKRLETSREYWDEIAPEGAEVYRGCGLFSKWVDGIEQVCDTAEGWFESTSPWSKDMYDQYDQDEGVVFRPDPTAERQRDELINVMGKAEIRGCMTRTDFENIADVILASGYTKP